MQVSRPARACALLLLALPFPAHAAEPATAAPAAANAFNPAISLILSGLYSHLSQDPTDYAITGFIPGGDIGPGKRGFSLAESELGVYANIDPWFYGGLNLSLAADNSVSVEEAFIQTIGLSRGLTIKGGRFYSTLGYLNDQHAHTWDFVDNPLAYQAFLGTQFNDDGVQVKWLAPTDLYLELGGEVGSGANFPGAERNSNGAGAASAFVHMGGDVGVSHSWLAGVSFLKTSPENRQYQTTDLAGNTVTNSYTGPSRLWIADVVWKWAPNGNPRIRNFKIQAEYLSRRESGEMVYDAATPAQSAGPVTGPYSSAQSGWYLQGIYQFLPGWRAGLRTERLDSGSQDVGVNAAYLPVADYRPERNSVILERAFSEFSRIRVQFARDKSREGLPDNQMFIQYQASLGAHGAHTF